MILAMCFQLKQLKKQPEKNSAIFQLLKLKAHCEDHNFTHVYPQFTYMSFLYLYSCIYSLRYLSLGLFQTQ